MFLKIYGFIHWIYCDRENSVNQHIKVITPTKLQDYMTSFAFKISMMLQPPTMNLVVVATKL